MTHSFPTRRSSDLKYMSRLYKINCKYLTFRKYEDNFIINIFLKKFIKEGNYFKAKNILINTLNFIKDKEKKNSYLIYILAIYNVTPSDRKRTCLNSSNQSTYTMPSSYRKNKTK